MMNKLLFLFYALMTTQLAAQELPKITEKDKLILWIGDSYLYYSNTDSIANQILRQNNLPYTIILSAFPGCTLAHHLHPSMTKVKDPRADTVYMKNRTIDLLTNYRWDKLVVEVSNEFIPNRLEDKIYNPIRSLKTFIHPSNSTLLLLHLGKSDRCYPCRDCGYNEQQRRIDCYQYATAKDYVSKKDSIFQVLNEDMKFKDINLFKYYEAFIKGDYFAEELYPADYNGHPNKLLSLFNAIMILRMSGITIEKIMLSEFGFEGLKIEKTIQSLLTCKL